MTNQEAMKLALEALYLAVRMEPSDSIHECPEMFQEAITALRNELAKQEQGEPVAWLDKFGNTTFNERQGVTPLYTTQQNQDEVERLTGALKRANSQAEHFEREWYLRGYELEQLKQEQGEPVALKKGECWPEEVMRQWDYWRKEIANGHKGSAPRDWFESLSEMKLIDTTPQQRKPLTPTEINCIESRWDASMHGSKIAFVVRETEAAHGIKE
jgi:hypothetical protein